MQKETPENFLEKVPSDSQSSKMKWEIREKLSESLIDKPTDDFLKRIESTNLDWALREIKNYKWLSPEIADLLLWVSSCDKLGDLALKMEYSMKHKAGREYEKEKNKNKRLIKKYQDLWDNESLDEVIQDMNFDQKEWIGKEKTIAFLLKPQKVDKYIVTVVENIDLFTKISAEWLKALVDAWYRDEVYEYLKKHKNYTRKS